VGLESKPKNFGPTDVLENGLGIEVVIYFGTFLKRIVILERLSDMRNDVLNYCNIK